MWWSAPVDWNYTRCRLLMPTSLLCLPHLSSPPLLNYLSGAGCHCGWKRLRSRVPPVHLQQGWRSRDGDNSHLAPSRWECVSIPSHPNHGWSNSLSWTVFPVVVHNYTLNRGWGFCSQTVHLLPSEFLEVKLMSERPFCRGSQSKIMCVWVIFIDSFFNAMCFHRSGNSVVVSLDSHEITGASISADARAAPFM